MFIDTYFSGFGTVYFFGYIVGAFCLIGAILGVFIYLQEEVPPENDSQKDENQLNEAS